MSTSDIFKTVESLYEADYNRWIEQTVKQLQERQYNAVDWENLIEEVADLSRRQREKLMSLLTRLFEHLLKLAYWESEPPTLLEPSSSRKGAVHSAREYNARGWRGEIRNFRIQIKRLLKNSPSLKPYILEIIDECYQDARGIVAEISGLPIEIFPEKAIATLDQILDENWFN